MIKSSVLLINKRNNHKSHQILKTEIPQMQKYDTNKIFQQFKRQLLKEDKKQKNKNFVIENAYKDLLSSIRKNNVQKKQKLEKINMKYEAIKNNFSTFQQNNSFKDDKNLSTKQDNFLNQKHQQFVQSKVNNEAQNFCKFKAIRPMTTDNKFRINNRSKSRLFENTSQSRLRSQVSRLLTNTNAKSYSNLSSSYMRKSQTMIPQNYPQKSLPEISQSIMMVQLEESKLQQQITSLSQSMNKMTKQLAQLSKQLQIQQRNEKKYKHISNLATSIKDQTEYIKIQNQKGFTTMVSKRDETLGNLKKFKMNLRKEKDDMETVYIDGINEFVKFQEEKNANKNKELLFMATNTPNKQDENRKSTDKNVGIFSEMKGQKQKGLKFQLICQFNNTNNHTKFQGQQSPNTSLSNTKLMKKLVDELDCIIELFQKKQKTFQAIKQQQCTRVRLFKINKQLLPKQRVQILEKIQQFESKYDMKIISVQNLMLRVYHMLYDENQRLESDCLKLTQSKQQASQELKKLLLRHGTQIQSLIKEDKLMTQQILRQKRLNSSIKRNSMVLLKIVEGFYNIFFKYRYMFSLALTLDVDKKLFRDTVIQIDALFSQGLMAGFGADKLVSGSNEKYDIISEYWFGQMLKQRGIDDSITKQLTEIMFNDHRVGFIVKKSWIESQLKQLSKSILTQSQFLCIIDTLHNDCSEIYQQKLPSLASLFLTCFKSLQMTKYESKLAASSMQHGEIFLPNRKVKRLCDPEFVDQINDFSDKESQDSSLQNSKKKISYVSESSAVQQDTLEKNPMKIIFNLQAMKNRSHKKFKALNFSSSGKTYKYNDSIIIPKFSKIDESYDL